MSTFEFHVSRAARQRYGFDEALFGLSGNVVFADFAAARRFAQKMNDARAISLPTRRGRARGRHQRHGPGRRDPPLRRRAVPARAQPAARSRARSTRSRTELSAAARSSRRWRSFAEPASRTSPPIAARCRRPTTWRTTDRWHAQPRDRARGAAAALAGQRRTRRFEPLRRAVRRPRPLEDGTRLPRAAARPRRATSRRSRASGPDNDDLVSLLRRPALEAPARWPSSCAGSAALGLRRWASSATGWSSARRADRGGARRLDALPRHRRRHRPTPAPTDTTPAPCTASSSAAGAGRGVERFSPDRDWMPRAGADGQEHLRLAGPAVARSTARPIGRLDQIPDEELDRLARAGASPACG